MTTNVGTIDRALRIVVRLALVAAAVGLYAPAYQTIRRWVGFIPHATEVISWCPVYSILGNKTCKPALNANNRM
ncbi:MAG: DUF2892 domain-containing protein [Hyphomicrobium aestuarii]|nr:DUF2892 domain-containing protein [Hyphomicrobium aestuarii]